MGFEIEGLDMCIKNLEKIKVNFPKKIEQFILEIGNRMLRKVKKKTPVGQYSNGQTGGDLRRSWEVGNVVRNGEDFYVEIYNPLHYGPHVEYGHRTRLGTSKNPKYKSKGSIAFVPGVFMLKISLAEIERELPKHLEKIWNSIDW
ncbi:bacteriophage HK97-gp10, putative tail-component [Gottschalkia purinilytica]|uniref:Bacteriophage HK97-gp10, putative tail-component n=1 Tax=Gottschalkia purinilytica TaxID=1503 RepID=A0A0L0W6Q4_GOTPU|nr:HK97 gp10 family phage protein [Gottschalkia purinilytica]KNF07167.1 bacteriophage HK97-gp10, putative tail-component [Gottschalkia purinilytica]